MAKNILRSSAFRYLIGCGLAASLLTNCSSESTVTNCGRQVKTVYWEVPKGWDGDLSFAFFLSKDNMKWQKQWDQEAVSFWINGQDLDIDTCTPTYYCVAMKDNYGHSSADAGCLGNDCKRVVIPKECFSYSERG